jgi:DinB superfamily
MRDPEGHEILHLLDVGRDALAVALEGVDEDLAKRRPEPERWSVLECVEHLAVAEELMLAGLHVAEPSDQSHENKKREAKILNFGLDRLRRIECPEAALPAGRSRTLREAVAQFEAVRTRTVRYVEEFSGDPRSRLTTHPLVYTPVNCYEMLLMIALHPARHAKQIIETVSALSNG